MSQISQIFFPSENEQTIRSLNKFAGVTNKLEFNTAIKLKAATTNCQLPTANYFPLISSSILMILSNLSVSIELR